MLDFKMQYLKRTNDKPFVHSNAAANIQELEAAIKADPASFGKDSPVFAYNHWFAPGLYGREITIPANVLLTTDIHASEHIAVVLSGAFTFYTDEGLEYIRAPRVMVTKIGTKRAMLTHTEVVFITFHHNEDNEKDIDTLVDRYTFKDEEAYLKYEQALLEVKK